MAHTSPAVNLVWALLSLLLGSFLLFHLWSFDRFKCLQWSSTPYSGAFKRVMTYSYLLSVPLLLAYGLGFSIIKYHYGFTYVPGYGVVPTPYELWSLSAQNAILPLLLCFSIAWSMEMITHLEELCFWLFLVNASSAQQDWFRSLYFKCWMIGSAIAVLYMPLVTAFTREDVLKCEAYTFLAGSLGSLSLTIWFLPILRTFPSFLNNLKKERVDDQTIIRLTTVHELNCIRIVFRFLFTVPLIILGVDGVRPHQHINDKMFPTDLLAIVASFGCIVSSGITLVIFFPRSVESEVATKEAIRRLEESRKHWDPPSQYQDDNKVGRSYLLSSSPVKTAVALSIDAGSADRDGEQKDNDSSSSPLSSSDIHQGTGKGMTARGEHKQKPMHPAETFVMQPNRRTKDGDVELGGFGMVSTMQSTGLAPRSTVNHLVHNFTSPIDLIRSPSSYRR